MAEKPEAEVPESKEQEQELDTLALLTEEVLEAMEHPTEVKQENGAWMPYTLSLKTLEALDYFWARWLLLFPVWETLRKALEKKSEKVKPKSVNEEVRKRILDTLTEKEAEAISSAFRKCFTLLDAVCTSDAATITVAETLKELSDSYVSDATEAVHLYGIPADLKEESQSSLVVSFNDCHSALKELQKHHNALLSSLNSDWSAYEEFVGKHLYRMSVGSKNTDKKEPKHPVDGRKLKSKYATEGENGSVTTKIYGHKKYEIVLAYKLSDAKSAKEEVRDLATAYRDPHFSLHSFLRELNREIGKRNLKVRHYPITAALLTAWIKKQNEAVPGEADSHDAINKHPWTVTVPGTAITIRRIVEETESPAVIATSSGNES